jgi:transposase
MPGFEAELIVVEATGGNEEVLIPDLFKAGSPVVLVSTKWVRQNTRACGLLVKTDQLDAINLFAMGEKPVDAWCACFKQDRREKIEQEEPFIKFGWESLGRTL